MTDKRKEKDKKIDEDRLKELTKKYIPSEDSQNEDLPEGNVYKGMLIGFSLVTHVLVGCAMGYGLDYAFGTPPLFMLIFIFLGFFAGIRQIYITMMK